MSAPPFPAIAHAVAARRKGDANLFVVGASEYQKFLDVMEGCTQVNIARRRLS